MRTSHPPPPRTSWSRRTLGACAVALLGLTMAPRAAEAACDPKVKPATFAAFKECTYREPDTGIWIVDGDVPITSEQALRKFYDAMVLTPATPAAAELGRRSVELIVNRVNNADDIWPAAQRCAIRYCVSRASTGGNYQAVVDAMAAAAGAWTRFMGTNMVHVPAQDGNCTPQNNQVEFDVQQVSGRPYLARAFFPAQGRATRNVLIDTTAFSTTPPLTLQGILRHEIGHALGFRHEHTRPEAGRCFEDNSWRPLTPYDSASVMHYPQCGGTAGWALDLSANDIAGGVALYGNATRCSQGGSPVDCTVFNDGYTSPSARADAIYFRAGSSVCIPDGTATGTCRKWFGRCTVRSSGERVNFTVFDDGYARRSAPSDAVYLRRAQSACTPDGTAAGNCRRWLGRPVSASGRAAQCYLFDNGYTNVVGPTDAIYAAAPNRVCMPDGTATGTCRRWFGRCQLK